jgi:hypothetical protein
MTHKTCAACDCRIEGTSIKVTVGGQTVDVCCDECARALNEAHAPGASTEAGEGRKP